MVDYDMSKENIKKWLNETDLETEQRLSHEAVSRKISGEIAYKEAKERDYILEAGTKLAHEASELRDKTYDKQLKDEPGLRYDAGKLRYDLIPPEVIDALAQVYTDGAIKYHDRNWEKGMSYSRVIRCIFSHLIKYLFGERFDKDLKECEHMAMVIWNAAAILTYDKRNMAEEFNDLPHWNTHPFKTLRPGEGEGIITKEISVDKMEGESIKI